MAFLRNRRPLLYLAARSAKIDDLSVLLHRTIEVAPLALDLDIRLIYAPTDPHRPLVESVKYPGARNTKLHWFEDEKNCGTT